MKIVKVLLAENDKSIQKRIQNFLEKKKYDVIVVSSSNEILKYLYADKFDLIILNQELLNHDHKELVMEINRIKIKSKLVVLTQRYSESQKKYMDINEITDTSALMMKINQIISNQNRSVYDFRELTLNPDLYEARKNGFLLHLTKKEYDLLFYFMKNINIILCREQILDNVWGMNYEGDPRTVDTHVKRLRKKIGSGYVVTKIGIGYVFGDQI